jgi:ABC-type dipeptide/oligopeptide/nickel transport system permease subunit
MGIDVRGRDVFTEIVYGARNVLVIAVCSMTLATLLGVTIGAVAGSTRGIIDETLTGVTDIFLAIPIFPLMLIGVRVVSTVAVGSLIASVPNFNMLVMIFFLSAFGWPDIARLARGECLRIKEEEFVEAARCIGIPQWRIILFQILPNALPSIIVIATVRMSWAIAIETQISFLGFGDASIPSWGNLLTLGMSAVQDAPWGVVFPTIVLALTVIAFNVFGDGLNDALNPRLRD